jgi:hypothetical protein
MSACAAPAPASLTASESSAGATSAGSPPPAATATPAPTLPPFSRSVVDDGWTVVASDNASGAVHQIRVIRQVRAGSVVRVYYACAGDGQIAIRLLDARADPGRQDDAATELVSFSTGCTSEVQVFVADGPSRRATISLEATVTDQEARYRALASAPDEDALPRR